MNGQRVGYLRVSSLDQNPVRQAEDVAVDRTFTDTASGKDTRRPALEALLGFVREGDTVVVHSMDRLARNLDDLRRIVAIRGVVKVAVISRKRRRSPWSAECLDRGNAHR
ncbi:MAG: recombinase family protein [Pseudonocardiaceae bacterium]